MSQRALKLIALVPVAFALTLGSVFAGGAQLAPPEIFAALLHPWAGGDANAIVWALRIPRIVSAVLVGSSLAVAGYVLQGMLRNPLVDPYLTGVSAGAGAAVALVITIGASWAFVPGAGFVAGLGTAALVAFLARRGTQLDAERLILAGVTLSALFAAFIALLLTRASPETSSAAIINWLAGSLAGRGWTEIAWCAPYTLAGLAAALLLSAPLNALRLGDLRAAALGVNVSAAHWALLATAALLTASAVSLAGIVGFAGLIVPHVARRLVGNDARYAIPAAAAIGPACIALADAAGRSLVAPAEIPLGVLLAFIGVPVFLYVHATGRRGAWQR